MFSGPNAGILVCFCPNLHCGIAAMLWPTCGSKAGSKRAGYRDERPVETAQNPSGKSGTPLPTGDFAVGRPLFWGSASGPFCVANCSAPRAPARGLPTSPMPRPPFILTNSHHFACDTSGVLGRVSVGGCQAQLFGVSGRHFNVTASSVYSRGPHN